MKRESFKSRLGFLLVSAGSSDIRHSKSPEASGIFMDGLPCLAATC